MNSAAQSSPQQVLIVEDDQWVTHSLANLLRGQGYDPVVFQDGRSALQYLRGNRPDIALIDIHLADISGLEISQQLRQSYGNDLPIIILSGDTSIETLQALPQVGATCFFSKPVHAARLLEQMQKFTAPAKA